jgi:hypothetical protein
LWWWSLVFFHHPVRISGILKFLTPPPSSGTCYFMFELSVRKEGFITN